jgi:hypothetical protein
METKTTNELLLELGTCIEQVQVLKRGLKEHPDDEIFVAGIEFFKQHIQKLMIKISRQ